MLQQLFATVYIADSHKDQQVEWRRNRVQKKIVCELKVGVQKSRGKNVSWINLYLYMSALFIVKKKKQLHLFAYLKHIILVGSDMSFNVLKIP